MIIAGRGVFIVGRFIDDYGNEIVAGYLAHDSFVARYYFYNEQI